LAAATNSDPNPDKGIADATSVSGAALVADAGPAGTFANLASSTAAGAISTYLVRPGDTLSGIAALYGVSINTIVWANNLGTAKSIRPGQTLVILPVSGVEHTVVKGDTLASVAKKFKGDANEIAEYNGLDPAASLAIGSTVIIPNGELTTVSTKPSSGSKGSVSTNNPYRGGSGQEIDQYFESPLPGGLLTQGLHGENAVDIAAPRGTLARAAADGIVIVARDNGAWNGGYGNYVVIAHGNGTQTLYAHFITGSVSVSVGQAVSQGETIGATGMTGDATGPHVHFEVRGALNPFGVCAVGTHVGLFSCSD